MQYGNQPKKEHQMSAYSIGKKLGKNLPLTILAAALIVGAFAWLSSGEPAAPRAMTAEEKLKSDQHDFSRAAMLAIYNGISDSAVNPKAVQTKNSQYLSNGACLDVNMPNAYGGFDGFKKVCFLKIDGKNVLTINGIRQ
jgi:hypothetical protein